QAMDESGSLPHARPRKSARRVQPDGARLQSASSVQYPWHGKADGRPGGMKTPQIAPDRAARVAAGRFKKPKRGQQPILAGNGETPVIPTATPLAIFNLPPFSHGLLKFCTFQNVRR